MFGVVFPYSLVQQGKISFKYADLKKALENPAYLSIFFVFLIITIIFQMLVDCFKWLYYNRDSMFTIVMHSVTFTFYLVIGYFLFIGSVFTFLKGIDTEPKLIPYFPVDKAQLVNDVSHNLKVINSYGLFRTMTGVEGRPELIIQGSNDLKEWLPYEFFYKPDDI